ncbi:MAG: carboxypeptidase regulatory-like domain-containing protein [Candidatus Bathyarchaeia archaeon]
MIKIFPVHASTFLKTWGSYGSGIGEFNNPTAVAVDSYGHVYVADAGNNRVEEFDNDGDFVAQFGGVGSGTGQFGWTCGVAVDAYGDVYVSDWTNSRIVEFSEGNLTWGTFGSGPGELEGPLGIAVDTNGFIYVLDSQYGTNNRVEKFDYSGTFITQFGSAGSGPSQFNGSFGVTVDNYGNVYVPDYNNSRVVKFGVDSTTSSWGTFGTGPGQLYNPMYAAIDDLGYVYLTDNYNSRVEKFDSTGNYITELGSYGTGDGQFRAPEGIAVDGSGDVFVADAANNRIDKFLLPNPPVRFVIDSVSEGSPVAGQPFDVIVTATDVFGNVVTGYAGTVHFSCSDSLAVLPSDYTFQTDDNGEHTFSVTFDAAGTQTLNVWDTLDPSIFGSNSWTVLGLTVVNVETDVPPSSDWNYIITVVNSQMEVAPGTVIENFTLPAGGGNITFSDPVFLEGGVFNITAASKFEYTTEISTQQYDDYSSSVIEDLNATLYLHEYSAMTVTFANAFVGAFTTQPLGSAPPSGINFSIPANQPYPIQAAWNVTLKNDGRIDLVVNKTMAILVNFTRPMQSGQAVNVTVTFNGTTYGQVVQQSALAQNSVIIFQPIIPKYNGTMTITGTYQIGTSANPSSLTGNPTSLASTAVTVKDTMILPIYFYSLTNSNYGSVNATDITQMVGNTTAFINATYPVKNVAVSASTTTIAGSAASNSPSKFQGIINDCIAISTQAAKSSYGKATRGIGIGPNNGPGQDYFTYHGAPGGAGFTVNPNCHGVVVLDGYYTAAAHEVGHTFGLNWPPTSEEYVTYPLNGKATSGIWPAQNQWRTGYDIMGTAPYRTLDLTWIDSTSYAQLLSMTKAAGNDPPLLIVSGLIYKDGTVVLPQTWYQLQSGVPDTVVPGNYALQFYDSSGRLISTTSFDAPFYVQIDPGVTVGQNMPDLSNFGTVQTDVTGFAFTIPYPQGTAQVNIVDNTNPGSPIVLKTVSAKDIVYVPPPTVNITFTTNGIGSDTNSATVMTIDSIPYGYSQLQSLSVNWAPGSNHTITVTNPVAATYGKQYAFINWTNGDGLKSGTSNYTVPNTDTVVTANFKTQFQLTVTTNPVGLTPRPWVTPSGTGSGGTWYEANTNVTLIASPLAINTLSNWYTFNYWVLDGTPQKTNTIQLKIKMDQAHTTIANYAHFKMKGYFTDSNFNPISSFTCITAPKTGTGYKISATYPATFYYNLQITNNDPTGTFTITMLVPSDFALTPLSPRASPVQIDGKPVTYSISNPGVLTISNVQIKQNQMITISVHLKYTDSYSSKATFSIDYPFIATVNLIQLTTTTITAVGKQMTAIGGFITNSNGAPKAGLTVTVTTQNGIVGTAVSANDGSYFITVPAGTYTVTITNSLKTQLAQVKNVIVTQNQFAEQDFTIK